VGGHRSWACWWLAMTGAEERTVRSFCRLCSAFCGILIDVEGDQVLRVRGDPDHPLSRGYTCPKGRALPKLHHHPERIERPMMLVGGELRPSTWEACLDDIGERLGRTIERYGPESVGVYFGSGIGADAAGYQLLHRLFQAMGTPAKFTPLTIDGMAKYLVSHLMTGFVGFGSRAHIDYERAKLVLYVGVNPVVSHGHAVGVPDPVSVIRATRAHAEVWVIDPRRTETARLATRHVASRPGTDYAIFGFLIRELLRDGAGRKVLERRCTGVAELASAVERFTLEDAAALAGIAEDDLVDLLQAVRAAGPIGIHTGTGVTMGAYVGNVTMWLVWALLVITGSMNRPGGMWFHPGFNRKLDEAEIPVAPPEGLFGPGPRSRPGTRSFLGDWPCAALPDEIRAGNIRAFLNFGGALLATFPDLNSLEPMLRSLDLLVTADIVANPTTAISTHVLPTKDPLERADINVWDYLIPSVAMQHGCAAIVPVGERQSAWWVIAEIGRRLGHDLADPAGSDDEVLARMMEGARCSYEQVASAGFVEAPGDALPAGWVERYLERAGGWRLAPPALVDQLAGLDAPAPQVLVPRRQKRKINASLDFLGETAEVLLHPDDAREVGIDDGQTVIVRSERGQLTATAKVDPAIRKGAISIPHGHYATNVNVLTNKDDIDPLTGMVRYSGISVQVEPAANRNPLPRTGG
jgi:anaerobic selenocysteine-containing dehydrogenase